MDRSGFVYAMMVGTLVKIGCSQCPTMRRYAVGGASTAIVWIVHTDDAVWAERYVHAAFAHRRVRGEFFALSEEDVARLQRIENLDVATLTRLPSPGPTEMTLRKRRLRAAARLEKLNQPK